MTQYVIQVSAHGMEPANHPPYTLPEEYEVRYFCKAGEWLEWDLSVEIYNELAQNKLQDVNKRVKNTIYGGGPTTDYALWGLGVSTYVSGTLLAGGTNAIVNIANKQKAAPISFSTLLAQTASALNIDPSSDTLLVYFNACRE